MTSYFELKKPIDIAKLGAPDKKVLSPRNVSLFGAIAVSTALLGVGLRSMSDTTQKIENNSSPRGIGAYSVGPEVHGSRVESVGRSYTDTLYVGSYGLLGSKVGTLGVYTNTQDMLFHTGVWGDWVKEKFSDKHVVSVLFPVLNSNNKIGVTDLISTTVERNNSGEDWLVMPTIERGSEQELMGIMSDMLIASPHGSDIGFMLDLEHFGRRVSGSELNRLIKFFGDKRAELGMKEPGLIGAWFFRDKDYEADEEILSEYIDTDGNVLARFVPIFDGFGSANEKWTSYQQMMSTFGSKSGGMMDFTWRWGNGTYDTNTTSELFDLSRIPTDTLKFLVQQ